MKTYCWIVHDSNMYHYINPVKVFLSKSEAEKYCNGTCLCIQKVELVK